MPTYRDKTVAGSATLLLRTQLNMQGEQIFNIAPPTDSDDAVTLAYLDGRLSGLSTDTDSEIQSLSFNNSTRELTVNLKGGNTKTVVIPAGGMGGSTYSAGHGIHINTDSEILVDTEVIADIAWVMAQGYITADSDTTYTAGTGLNLSDTEFSVDTSVIATRTYVSTAISNIADSDTTYSNGYGLDLVDTVFSVDTDLIADTEWVKAQGYVTTDTNTTYTAGTGLTLSDTEFSVDTNTIATQTYVTNAISNINDSDTTYSNGFGLNLTDTTFSVDTDRIADTEWVKAQGYVTTDTTYSSGFGLDLNGTTFAVDTDLIADTEWVKAQGYITSDSDTTYTFTAVGNRLSIVNNSGDTELVYSPAIQSNTGGTLAFEDEGVSRGTPTRVNFTGASVSVGAVVDSEITVAISDNNTTYTAGTGLNLSDTEFSVDTDTIAERSWVTSQGYLTTDSDTTYTAGYGLNLSDTEFSIDTDQIATQADLNLYGLSNITTNVTRNDVTITLNRPGGLNPRVVTFDRGRDSTGRGLEFTPGNDTELQSTGGKTVFYDSVTLRDRARNVTWTRGDFAVIRGKEWFTENASTAITSPESYWALYSVANGATSLTLTHDGGGQNAAQLAAIIEGHINSGNGKNTLALNRQGTGNQYTITNPRFNGTGGGDSDLMVDISPAWNDSEDHDQVYFKVENANEYVGIWVFTGNTDTNTTINSDWLNISSPIKDYLDSEIAGIQDSDTTYTISLSGGTLTLAGSDGSNSIVNIPDSDTTYTAGTGLSLTGTQFSIANSGVGTDQIANDAVNNAKIADNAIQTAQIDDDAVTADEIAANAVGAEQLNVTGNGTNGQVLTSDGDGTFSWTNKTELVGSDSEFISLEDTPSGYNGHSGDFLRVNSDTDAVEFFDPFPVAESNNRLTSLNGLRIRSIGTDYIEFAAFRFNSYTLAAAPSTNIPWDTPFNGVRFSTTNDNDFQSEYVNRLQNVTINGTSYNAPAAISSFAQSVTVNFDSEFLDSDSDYDGTQSRSYTISAQRATNLNRTNNISTTFRWSAAGFTRSDVTLPSLMRFDSYLTSYSVSATGVSSANFESNTNGYAMTLDGNGTLGTIAVLGENLSASVTGVTFYYDTDFDAATTFTASANFVRPTGIQTNDSEDFRTVNLSTNGNPNVNSPTITYPVWSVVTDSNTFSATDLGTLDTDGYSATFVVNNSTLNNIRRDYLNLSNSTGSVRYVHILGRGTASTFTDITTNLHTTLTGVTSSTIMLGQPGHQVQYNVYTIAIAANTADFDVRVS